MDVRVISTTELGDRSYVVAAGGDAVVVDAAARHRPGARRWPTSSAHRCGSSSRRTSTTTTSPAATRSPRRTGAHYGVAADDRSTSTGIAAARRRRARRRDDCASRVVATPGTHRPPPRLRRQRHRGPGGAAGGVHRRFAALRQRRAHRPGRSRSHRRTDPRAVPLRAPARATSCPTRPRLPDARLRQLLLRRLCDRRRHRARSVPSSARNDALTTEDEQTLRRHADRQPDRLSRRTTRTWRRSTGGARPRPICRHRRRSTRGARPPPRRGRVGRRSAQPRSPTPPTTSPRPCRSSWATSSAPTSAGCSPWGGPLTLIGESRGADRRGPAAAGAHRRRRARRAPPPAPSTSSAPTARAQLSAGRLRRGRGDSAPTTWWSTCAATTSTPAGHIAARCTCRSTSWSQRVDELPAGRLWVHCASGFRASIAASLLDRAGRDVVHVDDDYEKAAPAGLPIETAAAPIR